jgi:hypothetical protein
MINNRNFNLRNNNLVELTKSINIALDFHTRFG